MMISVVLPPFVVFLEAKGHRMARPPKKWGADAIRREDGGRQRALPFR